MRRVLYSLMVVAALCLTGCHARYNDGSREVRTDSIGDCAYYIYTIPDYEYDNTDTFYIYNEFGAWWPEEHTLTAELEQEVIDSLFPDLKAHTINDVCRQTLAPDIFVDSSDAIDWGLRQTEPIENITANWSANNLALHVTIKQQGRLLTFTVTGEFFAARAVHGFYGCYNLTVDLKKQRIVNFCDIFDTTGIGALMLRAAREIDDNADVYACLDEPDKALPYPPDFTIDLEGRRLLVTYPLYEIACYACGLQTIAIPAEWIEANMRLTDYGRELMSLPAAQ